MTNEFPNLTTTRQATEYIDSLYKLYVPEYRHYIHIIKSLKKTPMFMHKTNMTFKKGKYDSVIGTEKGSLKRKFLIEIDGDFMNVYRQEKKGQHITKFPFYKEYNLRELFGEV